MFSLSAKAIYGLMAMLELALNDHKELIQIKNIADSCSIPQNFLEQLLIILKKAGFIKSFRGNQGGYALKKSPGHIKVIDILECLDGELRIVQSNIKNDILDFFWDKLEYEVKDILNINLEDLILSKQKAEQHIASNI